MQNQNNADHPTQNSASLDNKNLNSIAQYLKSAQVGHKKAIPPLVQWNPQHCGKMDLKVLANGEWWHEGQLIQRKALTDLFASVLWKQGQKFYLKTPVEMIEIEVEDEPLLIQSAAQVEIEGKSYIQLMTDHDDIVIVDEAHSIFMREYQGQMRPYVHVRFGINALIERAAFFHLIEMGQLLETDQGTTILQLQSGDFYLQLQS
ncbi:DUF1285 domain-containing protein [Acinetobacter sp.]|uniref:DUF1285 domain-containing protein n=1 Tax=Acinetobacter sp. TaxID=472 RepID=UPI00388E2195